MIKQKIYIAGKVTGEKTHECTIKFGTMQKQLENLGYQVVNPLAVVGDWNTPWQEAMEMCLAALGSCGSIFMLPCSVDSKGAQIELDFAIQQSIDIYNDIKDVAPICSN